MLFSIACPFCSIVGRKMDRRNFLQNTTAAMLTSLTANAAISKVRTGMLGTVERKNLSRRQLDGGNQLRFGDARGDGQRGCQEGVKTFPPAACCDCQA